MGSTKNTLKKYQIVSSGDMSGAITSTVTNIQFFDNIGMQLVYTGTPVGTFTVEVSADYSALNEGAGLIVQNAGNWAAIDFGSAITATGAGDVIYLDMNQLSAPWVRLKYAATSGAGTLNAYIVGKSV